MRGKRIFPTTALACGGYWWLPLKKSTRFHGTRSSTEGRILIIYIAVRVHGIFVFLAPLARMLNYYPVAKEEVASKRTRRNTAHEYMNYIRSEQNECFGQNEWDADSRNLLEFLRRKKNLHDPNKTEISCKPYLNGKEMHLRLQAAGSPTWFPIQLLFTNYILKSLSATNVGKESTWNWITNFLPSRNPQSRRGVQLTNATSARK